MKLSIMVQAAMLFVLMSCFDSGKLDTVNQSNENRLSPENDSTNGIPSHRHLPDFPEHSMEKDLHVHEDHDHPH